MSVVLIIDPNGLDRRLAIAAAMRAGAGHVAEAWHGAEASELIEAVGPDVIVLDPAFAGVHEDIDVTLKGSGATVIVFSSQRDVIKVATDLGFVGVHKGGFSSIDLLEREIRTALSARTAPLDDAVVADLRVNDVVGAKGLEPLASAV